MIFIENNNLRKALKSIKWKLIYERILIIIIFIILKTHLRVYPSKFFIFLIETFKVYPITFTRNVQNLHGPTLTDHFFSNKIESKVINIKCFNKSVNSICNLPASFIMRIPIKYNNEFFDL